MALDLARRGAAATVTFAIATFDGSFVPGADRLADQRLAARLDARASVPRTTCASRRPATTATPPRRRRAPWQQPAATLAATPPPAASDERCSTPASGPIPIGGTSARSFAARGLQAVAELAAGGAAATWRSACSDGRRRSSWAVSRTSRIAAQSASRASAAATSPVRARLTSWRDAAGEISSALATSLVAEPVELAHQQRGALLLGQVGEVLDQPPQLVPAAERAVDVLARAGAVAVGELGGGERLRRSSSMQRLRTTRCSHGLSSSGRRSSRSARCARRNASWTTPSGRRRSRAARAPRSRAGAAGGARAATSNASSRPRGRARRGARPSAASGGREACFEPSRRGRRS